MSASNASAGFGSIIAYSTTSGGTFAKIGQSIDLETPTTEVGEIKITNNDSPANSHEYIPGMIEPGEMEFEIIYFKTMHEALLSLAGNNLIYWFKETFPDGTISTFPGFFKSVGIATKTEDEAMKGKIKIKLTQAQVFS